MDGDNVIDECRGVLSVRADGRYECTDPCCESPDPVRHEWRTPTLTWSATRTRPARRLRPARRPRSRVA